MSPLTTKGRKVKKAMTKQYGKKKAAQVFHASRNKGQSRAWTRPGDVLLDDKRMDKTGFFTLHPCRVVA